MTKHLHIAFAPCKDRAGIVVKTAPGLSPIAAFCKPITPGPYADWQALLCAIQAGIEAGATELTLYGSCPALQELQLTRRLVREEVAAYHFQAWRWLVESFGKNWHAVPIAPGMNPAYAVAEERAA